MRVRHGSPGFLQHLRERVSQLGSRLRARLPQNLHAVLPLVAGAAIALGSGLIFLQLGKQIGQGRIAELDDAVLLWIAERRGPALSKFFLAVTALGSWPVLVLLTIGICIGALLARQYRLTATLAIAMLGAPLLTDLLKSIYARDRPRVVPHLETVASASFPSGHSIASVTFFTTLALLVAGHTPRRRLRVFLVVYSLVIGALVAASRMYLGVHFPSDVTGGALVGVAWSLSIVVLDRLLRGVAR